jgi:YjbE family integral membrane protein
VLQALGIIAGIVLLDLALSGDNALVIGAAAAELPRGQRRVALLVGGAGAIVLRIILAVAATLLLQLPLLQAIGGVILILIAFRLLHEREAQRREAAAEAANGEAAASHQAPHSFLGALLLIMVADVTMSLDNVLSVGALASGHVVLLSIGLLISIAILLVGSAIVAELIDRLPWLLDVAAIVLAGTAAHMLLQDAQIGPSLRQAGWVSWALYLGLGALVLLIDLALRRRTRSVLAQLSKPQRKTPARAGR